MNHQAITLPSTGLTKFQPKTIFATKEQDEIRSATDKTILIEANAGAAKTTTLALRMAESWARGVAPELFLALTYTDTACAALRAALQKIGVPYSIVRRFRIQTFEAFCTEILDEVLASKVPVIDQEELLLPFIWQAVHHVEHNEHERWRLDLLLPALGDNGMAEEFLRINSWFKGTMRDTIEREDNLITPDYASFIGVEYTQLRIFLAYEKIRSQELASKPLFRGINDATYDLARMVYEDESLTTLSCWPSSLRVLLVDEMHDMNQATFRILQELLTSTSCFFCGVGDRDQVIHEKAGAEARFMHDQIEIYTRRLVTRYPLTHSYRFGKTLAAKAGRVADKPYSSRAEHDTKVAFVPYEKNEDCVKEIVKQVVLWKSEPKAKMDELAILLRHSHQSVSLENALLNLSIPYAMSGFESYLLRPEILFVRGILAVAVDDLKSISDSVTRREVVRALIFFSGSSIQIPGREHESQELLLKSAIDTAVEVPSFLTDFFNNHVLRNAEPSMKKRLQAGIKAAQEPPGHGQLEQVLDALKIKSIIREVFISVQRRDEALANLAGLENASSAFNSAQAYFQSLNEAELKQKNLKKLPAKLLIASIANIKGLEFDHVVLPYLERGVFPVPSANSKEEQNMFYVGMTRARLFLTLMGQSEIPSSFLAKIGY